MATNCVSLVHLLRTISYMNFTLVVSRDTMGMIKYLNWPYLRKDAEHIVRYCSTCQLAKPHPSNTSLYTPLSVPQGPLRDLSMDFVLGLPWTRPGSTPSM